MADTMLTTIDNPYNPFDNFDQWYSYDSILASQQGRPTVPSYQARKFKSSRNYTEKMEEDELDRVNREIVELNVTGKYLLITEEEAAKRLI